jgi:hypothetical protein
MDYCLNTHKDPLIHLHTTSEGLMSEEVRRTGIKALPLMSVTFFVILAFTVLTSLKRDVIKSKPWEAFIGVMCPILSLCASFGCLFWVRHNSFSLTLNFSSDSNFFRLSRLSHFLFWQLE